MESSSFDGSKVCNAFEIADGYGAARTAVVYPDSKRCTYRNCRRFSWVAKVFGIAKEGRSSDGVAQGSRGGIAGGASGQWNGT